MKPIFALSALILLCLPSCSGGNSSLSSQEQSSSSALSSSPQSQESSSSSIPTSSTSSSAQKDEVIALYDPYSVLYCVDGVRRNNPYLKTYRHKDKEDVPYVDVDEFRQVFRNAYTDYRIRGFRKDKEGVYVLYNPAGGEIVFDANAQTIKIADARKANYDFGSSNNGIDNDVCLDWRFLKESNKTKSLVPPTPVTIELNRYQMGIVEQDGHLYAPLSLLNHLIVKTNSRAISYNGRDYFADNLLGDAGLARAYSGKNGACISLQQSKFSRYHYDRITPSEGEAYHYRAENVTANSGKPTTCDLIFKTDGTCTAKTADSAIMPTFDFVGTWQKDGDDFISYAMKPADEEGLLNPTSDVLDISDKTYYRVTTRTRSMAIAHYYDLCLDFDYLYGEKVFHGYDNTDDLISRKGLKDALMSSDTATYYNALGRFLMGDEMGDAHVTLRNEGFASLDPKRNLGEFSTYAGKRKTNYDEAVKEMGGIRSSYENYQMSGATASIFIPSFMGSYKEGQSKALLQNVYTGDEETKIAKIGRAINNDMIIGLGQFLNDVKNYPQIKNIVFDVSGNLGGYAMWIPYLLAIMTDDPYVSYRNSIDGSIVEYHYHADLDGDGVFGGPNDTMKGKYNFSIGTAGASFSAGNIFPTSVKNSGIATLIGKRTAGGACGVASRSDLTGYLYTDSGPIAFTSKQGDNYVVAEDGIEPDVNMELTTLADCAKLDEALKNLAKPA